jgi:hypothetical protein
MQGKIYIMHTEAWEKYSFQSYISYLQNDFFFNNNDDIKREFIKNIKSWNETYNPFYTEFRHKIKEISSKNLSKSGFPVVVRQESQKLLVSHEGMTRDEFYILCDDDDFINPKSPELIASIFEDRPDIDLIHWDAWQYKTCCAEEHFFLHDKEKYGNCIAIRGGLDDWRFYASGSHIFIEEMMPQEKVLKIEGFHSLWNVHSASFYINQTFPLDEHIRTPKRGERLKCFDWAEEEVEAMFLLASSLKRIK